MMSYFFDNPAGFVGFGFGWIMMIGFWLLAVIAIIAFVRWFLNQSQGSGQRENSALDILKERYAKGEINKKEFEIKKKDLT
jgi:putative membrane protein